jgi:hypothetical protein
MKTIFVLFLLLMMGGCASPKFLENRITCTVGRDEAQIVSKWGPFGISAQVAADDAKVLCK